MPSYITKKSGASGSCCTTNNTESCQSSISFFSKLSEKMLDMVNTLKKQFQECKDNAQPTQVKGFFLASIETPKMVIGVKMEYIEYIKRYGPPSNGQFDETLLVKLRTELGIVTF
jgi:hypothetical protein